MKRMKLKFVSAIAIVASVALCISGCAKDDSSDGNPETSTGTGTAADPYQISTAEQLVAMVNGSYDLDNEYFKLTESIDMNNVDFTPISYGTAISGLTFDGNYKTISNLKITSEAAEDTDFIALFYSLDNESVVKNLTIKNPTISGAKEAGAIVGNLLNSTLENCHVVGGSVESTNSRVGGLVGTAMDATIKDCSNTGTTVSGTLSIGGLVGREVGENGTGSISGCSNSGAVTGSSDNVGGIVGYCVGNISDCVNSGDISAGEYGEIVGGIAGWVSGDAITNCSNSGTVVAYTYFIGGVVGWLYGADMENCYNTGNVGSADAKYIGGVVGWVNNPYNTEPNITPSTIVACYNSGVVTGENYIGGVCAHLYGKSDSPTEGDYSKMIACYNTGSVYGKNHVGGIVYTNHAVMTACYNTGGLYRSTGSNSYFYYGMYMNDAGTLTAIYYVDVDGDKPSSNYGISSNTGTGSVTKAASISVLNDTALTAMNTAIGEAGYDYRFVDGEENPPTISKQ